MMKKKVLAMVLVVAMVASMSAIVHAANISSDAGIGFWANNNGPILVDPGVPGETPGNPQDPNDPWNPPTDDDDVIAQITRMDSNSIDFHEHNLAFVRSQGSVTMYSLEGTVVPDTAVNVPGIEPGTLRGPGNSRLGVLVYMEGFGNWTLQANVGGFTYTNAAGEAGRGAMGSYNILLTQNGETVAAPHSETGMTPTTWSDSIALIQNVPAFIVANNQGGQGIHGQEFAGRLQFPGANAPTAAVRAQADITWTLTNNIGGINATSGEIDFDFDLGDWE